MDYRQSFFLSLFFGFWGVFFAVCFPRIRDLSQSLPWPVCCADPVGPSRSVYPLSPFPQSQPT